MKKPTISAYTTSHNCFEMNYPLESCINSLLGFADEVCVADGGSDDGTLELLESFSKKESRFSYSVHPIDFEHPRWAIHSDGYQKANARAMCTADYCWQIDSDEIVVAEDFDRIRHLPVAFKEVMEFEPVVFMPMIEFWGSFDTIRADFLSWKPRFSLNDPNITHGIPLEFRMVDPDGHEYPRPFESDSCNYIYKDSQMSVPMCFPLKTDELEMGREKFEEFFTESLRLFPSVLHVSWLNLERKIEHYRKFWVKFHSSMYNKPALDNAEGNVMFDKPWSEVSDSDIKKRAQELQESGPRFFMKKDDDNAQSGLTIPYQGPIPADLRTWHEKSLTEGMLDYRLSPQDVEIKAKAINLL